MTEVQVNERFLKISGLKRDAIPLNEDLQIDSEGTLKVEFQVIKSSDETNNDGTVDRTYTVKGLFAEKVE